MWTRMCAVCPPLEFGCVLSGGVFLMSLSSPVTECKGMEENLQQNKREDRRKKLTVEVIHVNSSTSMENQCAQQ